MILVTGGAGFIGSNLVAHLVDEGRRVCVNDLPEADAPSTNLAKHAIEERVPPAELDAFLARRADEIELVFHLGAITSTTATDTALLTETNVRLSQRLWRWCAEHEVPLVYASSAATYGDGAHGFRDVDSAEELEVFRPLNAYAQSKHDFDRWAAREAARGADAPPSWYGVKLFNVYGPNEYHKGDMQSVVAKAYARAARGEPVTLFRSHHPDYADGGQLRDFVWVADCVHMMTWLAEQRPPSGIYNCGTGRAQSWLEFIGAMYAAMGKPPNIEWVDVPLAIRDRYQYRTEADLTKLRAADYTRPFAPVEVGVGEYVARYLSTADPYR
ncbi:MAG: ADP-glyceromanno-heptose 6-epimerase [Longimicrobiales bacterium]